MIVRSRKHRWVSLGLLGLGFGIGMWALLVDGGRDDRGTDPADHNPSFLHDGLARLEALSSQVLPEGGLQQTGMRPPDTLRAVLYQGSFAGTKPVGDWCVEAGRLTPCALLRDRFEYYINGLGEITAAEVRSLIEDEARRAHGAALAIEIMAVYDKYWLVRNHDYRNQVDMADVKTWMPALQEAQLLRKQVLGEAWAKAFFAEEEHDFLEVYQRAQTGTPPPPSPRDPVPRADAGADANAVRAARVERYGVEVANQLDALDTQQREFDRKVSQARAEWRRLQGEAQLSEPEREAQLQRFIAERFDTLNQRRAAVLAKLPGS